MKDIPWIAGLGTAALRARTGCLISFVECLRRTCVRCVMRSSYSPDSVWRNRSEFFSGRPAIIEFLTRKWANENEYRLIKELWAFTENRIAVRFAYESHDDAGNWFRSYGNENWEFDALGYMCARSGRSA